LEEEEEEEERKTGTNLGSVQSETKQMQTENGRNALWSIAHHASLENQKIKQQESQQLFIQSNPIDINKRSPASSAPLQQIPSDRHGNNSNNSNNSNNKATAGQEVGGRGSH